MADLLYMFIAIKCHQHLNDVENNISIICIDYFFLLPLPPHFNFVYKLCLAITKMTTVDNLAIYVLNLLPKASTMPSLVAISLVELEL